MREPAFGWMTPEVKKAMTAFREMRRKKRQPLTNVAEERLLGKLDRLNSMGHPPAEVLLQSVDNGWTGVFEIKVRDDAAAGGSLADRNRAAADAFKRERAAEEPTS